jgi:thioredoxin-related protein
MGIAGGDDQARASLHEDWLDRFHPDGQFFRIKHAPETLTTMMKAITWLASVTVGVATLSASAFATTLEGWTSDLDKAFERAKAENKSVLVEFTGSDWCPPCIAMRKNVFSKREFIDVASKNFILVGIDLPKGDKALREKNEPLAEKFKVEGFPTIILFTPEGVEFTRFFGSEFPRTEDFLGRLDMALERKDLD